MLPKNLKYGSKVESAPAKSYRSNIAPQNGTGTYGLGDTIIVNIPTRANLVLVPSESYLKFNVAFTNGSANNFARWDSCGAHGLIQRIRIFHGSNLLQDIDNYGLLAKMIFDLQVPTDASYGKFNMLAGTRNDLNTQLPTLTNVAGADTAALLSSVNTNITAVLSNTNRQSLQINSGELIANNIGAGDTTVQTYCLNLISLLGTLCSQNYLPLFACTSAPIRMEIQLIDNPAKGIVSVGALTALKLSNCEYIANFIELSDQAMSLIQGSLEGSPLQFVVPDYRNYQYVFTLTNATTQVQMPIPAKFSSLKSLFVTVRDQGTGTLTYFPFSSVGMNIIDYTFRVGSQLMPAKAPNTTTEIFSEVLKAIGSMSNLDHHPSIEKFTFNMNASTQFSGANNASVNSGSFYIGLDLENYASASKDAIFAGYNSNTDDIYAIMNFGAQGGNVVTRFDAFALFDEVIVFDSNTAYVRF